MFNLFRKNPFAVIAAFLIFGIILGWLFALYNFAIAWVLMCVLMFAAVSILFAKENQGIALLCLFFLGYGSLISSFHIRYPSFNKYDTVVFSVRRIINSEFVERGSFKIAMDGVIKGFENASFKGSGRAIVYVNMPYRPRWDYGDLLKFDGNIKKARGFPFSAFKYVIWVNERNKIDYMGNNAFFLSGVRLVKKRIENFLDKGFKSESSAVLGGMLTGSKVDISSSVKNSFRKGGISHVMAVSGLHVGVLTGCLYFIVKCLGLKRSMLALLFLCFFIWCYIALTGFATSAMRAGIMASLVLIASFRGRFVNFANILSLAVIIILVFSPLSLFTPSFQLSFCAVGGILFYTRYFKSVPSKEIADVGKLQLITGLVWGLFKMSCVIWVFTAPIILLHFNTINLLSPFINVPVVLVAALLINAGFAAFIISLLSSGIAVFLLKSLEILIRPLIYFSEVSARFSFTVDNLAVKLFSVAAVSVFVAGAIMSRKKNGIKALFYIDYDSE